MRIPTKLPEEFRASLAGKAELTPGNLSGLFAVARSQHQSLFPDQVGSGPVRSVAHSGKGVAATQPLLGAWSVLRNHFWLRDSLRADQRYVLRTLVERQEDIRGEALFALGYWAGCRVSDVAWLRAEHVHIRPKVGWAYIGGRQDA